MSNGPRSAPKESKRSTREKAAAARAAAEAEQRRRDRRVRIVGGTAILVVVGLIVGLGVWGSRQGGSSTSGSIVADAALPSGVLNADSATPWGFPENHVANKPTLAIWEDFQCPVCGNLEKTNGAAIRQLAADGKVNLVWRPTTFIDDGQAASTGPNPGSSHRATMAWGCAIDAGKGTQYHTTLFANQPATEGNGWTDQQLLDFGTTAGITGSAYTTFESCVKAKTYDQWVTNSYLQFTNDAVAGTPTAYLNGKEVPSATLYDPAALEKLIASTPAS